MESGEENNTIATYRRTYGRHACNAWNCKNRQRNKYSNGSLLVHRFPKEPERCKEWLRRAGREDLMDKPVLFLSSNLSLCSEHFEPHCYWKKNKLRNDALPTIFNTGQSSASSSSEFDLTEQTEYLSNDHGYCKVSPLSNDDEKMEIDEEVVLDDPYNTGETEDDILPENTDSDYLPQGIKFENHEDSTENVKNSNVATVDVPGDKSSVHLLDASFEEQQQEESQNNMESFSVDDIRSLNIQPFTESVSSWEKIPDQICRLCATKNESHPKQSIVRWLGLLNEIVPGMVALDDGLPQQVCKPCLKKLYTAIRIKVEFTEADETLQNDMGFIKSSNTRLSESEKNVCETELQTDIKLEEDALHTPDSQLKHDLNPFEEEMETKVDNCSSKEFEVNREVSSDNSNEAAAEIENYYIENQILVGNEINFVTSDDDTNCYINKNESLTSQSENLNGHETTRLKVNKIAAPIKRNKSKNVKSSAQLPDFEFIEYKEKSSPKHEPEKHSEQKVKFNCLTCGEQFLSKARLQAHKAAHIRTRKADELTCKVCNGQFLFKRDLVLHVGTHYNGKPYGCEQCGKRYRSIFRLKTHKMYHFPPRFSCDECGKKFHLQSVLASHMKAHSEKSRFICDICGRCLSSESILEGHLRMHEGLKPFQCNLCGKCYQSYDCLRFHKLRHRGARFFCEICGKGTKDKTAMKAHMNTHTKELACKCPICFKTFANANSRAKHLKRTCTTVMCIVCDKTFETVELLEDHRIQEHSKEEIEKAAKAYRTDSILYCEECSIYIAGNNQMENHMLKVHDLENVFKCKQCVKCFLSDDILQEHVNSCSVDKVRKLTDKGRCIICYEVLTGTNEIMKHMRSVHKDYRPYLCEICPKSFLTKKELECHSLRHTQKKPFQCSQCNYRFKCIRTLKSHELSEHF